MKHRTSWAVFSLCLLASAPALAQGKPKSPPAKPAKPADKPAAKPADKPAAKPADKPAAKPAAKPADKPADKPKPVDKPAVPPPPPPPPPPPLPPPPPKKPAADPFDFAPPKPATMSVKADGDAIDGASGADHVEVKTKKRMPEMVSIGAGGMLLFVSDALEKSHQHGGLAVNIIYRPIVALEIEGAYHGSFGGWSSRVPAVTGGTTLVDADERIHRGDLGVRYDVLRTVDAPVRLEPYAGGAYQEVNSTVWTSKFFGGGGGLRFGYDPDPRVSLDFSGGIFGGADFADNTNAVLGKVGSIWQWSAGVAVNASDHVRVKLAYIGEDLERKASHRLSNGALLSFELGFGSIEKSAKTTAQTAKPTATKGAW